MSKIRKLGLAALATTPLLAGVAVFGSDVGAIGLYGEETCLQPFVWREAGPEDRVCVPVSSRSQAASENAAHPLRVAPGGGAYGPNTCVAPFVWRDAFAGDQICVTPEMRNQAAAENAAGPARRAINSYRATRAVSSASLGAGAQLHLRFDGVYDFSAKISNTSIRARDVAIACGVPLTNGSALTFSLAGRAGGFGASTTPLQRVWRDGQVTAQWNAIPHDQPLFCRLGTNREELRRSVISGLGGPREINLDVIDPNVPRL